MKELVSSPYFGIGLTALAYWLGVKLQRRTGLVICNALLLSVGMIAAVLAIFRIPYDDYNVGGGFIHMFLAPATACLAVTVYDRLDLLRRYWLPVLVGCTGVWGPPWAAFF